MDFNVCGMRFYPPSFREIADQTSNAAHAALRWTRTIELYEYVLGRLQETMERVRQVFEQSKGLFLLTGMSMIAALLDPAPFFGAMGVGIGANFIVEFMHGTEASSHSIFLDRIYELFIAETALVTVNLGCKAIQLMNFQYFLNTCRDGAVSSMVAGLLAGGALTAFAKRVYGLAVGRIGRDSAVPAHV